MKDDQEIQKLKDLSKEHAGNIRSSDINKTNNKLSVNYL